MNKRMMTIFGATAAVLLLASGVAMAAPSQTATGQAPTPGQTEQAQKRRPIAQRGPIVTGRVQSVDGSAIVLLGRKRSENAPGVSITTNSSTTFYAPGVSNATISNVTAGDRVAILIDTDASSENVRVASAVSVLPQSETALVAGEVSDITASGFTLTGRRAISGTVNAGSAKVIVPGKTSATLSDVQNGDRVAVQGAPTGDQSLNATLIVVIPENRDNVFGGVIASVNGNTLVLFTPSGEQLTVDATNAVLFQRGDTAPTLADLKVGRAIGVIGVKNSDGSVSAQLIGKAGLRFFGKQRV